MKKILLFLLIASASQAYSQNFVADTTAYWHVYRNNSLILKGNPGTTDMVITITKGNVFEKDMFEIEYHPVGVDLGNSIVVIENANGERLEQLEPMRESRRYQIKTKKLQTLAHQNRGGKLSFYYVSAFQDSQTQKLFEVVIK